ncbi:hypothetical protein CRG98_040767 [Punica granatum]|uniref:Uncharacterized protein n=1 Tax=Punica granatum TaxID=22663 RepID=A0A2I0I4A4_PUNGR|nr:hypothetical protein CRG98_040767 [Punica granatum]
MRTQGHELQERSRGPLEKHKRAIRRIDEQRTPKTAKADTAALFIAGSSEHQKPGHPRTLTDAFPDEAPRGPDPWTSKRHSETGLHTPKDHRDHGTSFRQPFGVRLGLSSESRPGKGDLSQTGSSAQSSFSGKLTSEFQTLHSLQLLGLGKSFRLGPRKSIRSPE